MRAPTQEWNWGLRRDPVGLLAPVTAAILTIAAIVAASLSLTAGPALAKGTYQTDGSLLFANDFPVRCA